MSEQTQTERELIEAGAYRAHELAFPTAPVTEPLRSKGGVLDPDAWCMKFATAVYQAREGEGLPRLYSNVEPPEEWAEQVAVVMGLRAVDNADV